MRKIWIVILLAMTSALHANELTELLQSFETSLATLEQGYTLVNNGLKLLNEQQTLLSGELDTLARESTELGMRLENLETSWNEQKQATDALYATVNGLKTEVWIYRGGLAILAGLVVWALIK
jgi:chromosome segregation ATPase